MNAWLEQGRPTEVLTVRIFSLTLEVDVRAARAYLTVIARHPDAVREALAS